MGKTYRVSCKGLDESGRGKVTFNNRPFAVPYFLPGEKGSIELVYRAKETTAKLVNIDTISNDRVAPECPVYEFCGGCQLLHMDYSAQLAWKQSRIEELFPKEAKEGRIAPICAMEHPWQYRHKVYASFSTDRKGEPIAGIYEENSHKIVKTKECRIQNKKANEIIQTVVDCMKKTKTPAYDEDKKTGVLRHIYIRVGEKTGQIMVVLVTGTAQFREKNRFVQELRKKFPEIVTILHNVLSLIHI